MSTLGQVVSNTLRQFTDRRQTNPNAARAANPAPAFAQPERSKTTGVVVTLSPQGREAIARLESSVINIGNEKALAKKTPKVGAMMDVRA